MSAKHKTFSQEQHAHGNHCKQYYIGCTVTAEGASDECNTQRNTRSLATAQEARLCAMDWHTICNDFLVQNFGVGCPGQAHSALGALGVSHTHKKSPGGRGRIQMTSASQIKHVAELQVKLHIYKTARRGEVRARSFHAIPDKKNSACIVCEMARLWLMSERIPDYAVFSWVANTQGLNREMVNKLNSVDNSSSSGHSKSGRAVTQFALLRTQQTALSNTNTRGNQCLGTVEERLRIEILLGFSRESRRLRSITMGIVLLRTIERRWGGTIYALTWGGKYQYILST